MHTVNFLEIIHEPEKVGFALPVPARWLGGRYLIYLHISYEAIPGVETLDTWKDR